MRNNTIKNVVLGILAFAVLIGFFYLIFCFRTVPFGTVRAVKLFGELTGEVWNPGAHWKLPWESTEKISVLKMSYETSDNPDESEADYTDYTIPGQTNDGQQISINYTVIFSIPSENVVRVLNEYGSLEMVVENIVKVYSRSLTRQYAQENFIAEQLYGNGIMDYEEITQADMAAEFEKCGIILDDLLIRKISFSEAYINSVEAKQIAQENIKTQEFNSQAAAWEAQAVIEEARGTAEQQVLLAEASATEIRLLADAEAYAIEAKGAALRKNPEMLQWQFVSNLSNVNWGILDGSGLNMYIPVER